MKISKTLLLDTFRNIVKKMISFLSIMAIMIVGIGGILTGDEAQAEGRAENGHQDQRQILTI